MNNIRPMPSKERLYDQASQWIVKMDKGLSPDEETALREWLQADPQNYSILMEMTQLWDKMDAMSRLSDLFAKPTATPQWRTRQPRQSPGRHSRLRSTGRNSRPVEPARRPNLDNLDNKSTTPPSANSPA